MSSRAENMQMIQKFGAAWNDFMSRTSDYVFVKDANLVYLGASRAVAEIAGFSDPSEIAGRSDYEIFADHELADQYRADDLQVLQTGEPTQEIIEILPRGKDGGARYCSISKYAFKDDDGKVAGVYAVGHDITREYTSQLHYESELTFLTHFQSNTYATALFDVTAWHVAEGRANEKMGVNAPKFTSIEDYKSNAAAAVVEDEDVRRFFRSFTKESILAIYNSGRRRLDMEYLRSMPDGTLHWVRDEMRFIAHPISGHIMLLFALFDIDNSKRTQGELVRAAEQDSMTGLLNHDSTVKHISRYIAMEGSSGVHALFMIDIDNFKKVNDIFGHQMGDDVITDIASTLKKTFRDTDIVGRIGGDEFMALMKNAGSRRSVARKAAGIIDAMQYDIRTNQGALELSGSIGISVYDKDHKPFDRLYAEADAALYKAKNSGKNHYCFADSASCETEGLSPGDADLPSAVHLRTLLEDLQGAVIVCDLDIKGGVRLSYASPSVFKTFRRSKEEVGDKGQNLFSTVLPDDQPGLLEAIKTALTEDSLLDCTYRAVSPEKETEWRHIRGSVISGSGRENRRLVCVITDVTDIKKTEEELKFAELRSRTALEQSFIMLWEVDLRTREMKYAGFSAEEQGYTQHVYADAPESVIAEGHIRSDTVAEFRRMFANLYAGDDSGEYYVMSRAGSGEYVPVRVVFRLLRDESGTPYYAIGIREPRVASKELALYRTLNDSGVFSVLLDDDFTLLYGNDRYYSILGYTLQSMAEKLRNKCRLYIHPDDLPAMRAVIDDAIASGQGSVMWVMRVLTASGEVKQTRNSGEFVKQKDGRYVMNGVLIDVTNQTEQQRA